MKKALLLLTVVSLFLACQNRKNSPAEQYKLEWEEKFRSSPDTLSDEIKKPVASLKGGNDAFLAEVKKEPKVLDATITSANVLYVSMANNGSRRDGFADYLCQVKSDFNTTVTRIKIVAHGTAKSPDRDNAYGILIGESNCRY